MLFYVLFVCKCVLYYRHRLSTQLQLTNISISILATLYSLSHNQQQNVTTSYNPFFPNNFHIHTPGESLTSRTSTLYMFISSHSCFCETYFKSQLPKSYSFISKPQDRTPFFHKTVWESKTYHIHQYSCHTDCHSNSSCSFHTSYIPNHKRIIMATRLQCCVTFST
jgi:hypothetical protein